MGSVGFVNTAAGFRAELRDGGKSLLCYTYTCLKTSPLLPWKSHGAPPEARLAQGQAGSLIGFLFGSGKCAGIEQRQTEHAFLGLSAISHTAAAAHD